MENFVNIDDFKKLDIRVGTVLRAEKVEGADKLLKIIFDFGEEEPRQIVTGMAEFYSPEDFVGKQMPAILNLKPVVLKGVESNGMILSAGDGSPVFLLPEKEIANGSIVK